LLNAIYGSALIVLTATLVSTPIGILAGIYSPSNGRNGAFAEATRFVNDILLSAPSIVLGCSSTVYVLQVGHFRVGPDRWRWRSSPFRWCARTTENMSAAVPSSLREAAVALGAPMWKVILMVTLKAVRGGVITGVLLAVARMSGETAPLALHRAQQPILEHRHERTDANLPVRDIPVRDEPVRRLEDACMGGRTADHA
jgi:phosphate transport system permease protein